MLSASKIFIKFECDTLILIHDEQISFQTLLHVYAETQNIYFTVTF